MKNIFLLTGSNIEPRMAFLEKAQNEIRKKVGEVFRISEIYESEPWGFNADTKFLNQVLLVKSNHDSNEVLRIILEIEKNIGRVREGSNYSSRNIDIDILYFGEEIIQKKHLQIPHPRLHNRKFTLLPLCEIAPDFTHPVFKLNQLELLEKCDDNSVVNTHKPKVN